MARQCSTPDPSEHSSPRAGTAPLSCRRRREVNSWPHAEAGATGRARALTMLRQVADVRRDGRGSVTHLHPAQSGTPHSHTEADKPLEITTIYFRKKILPSPEPTKSCGVIRVRWGSDPDSVRGFGTHGRIFPVARRAICSEVLDPRVGGRGSVMIPAPCVRPDVRPAHLEFPSATSWLTSQRSPAASWRGHDNAAAPVTLWGPSAPERHHATEP